MAIKTYQECQVELMDAFDALVAERAAIQHQHAPRLSYLMSLERDFQSKAENMAKALQAAWHMGTAKAQIEA